MVKFKCVKNEFPGKNGTRDRPAFVAIVGDDGEMVPLNAHRLSIFLSALAWVAECAKRAAGIAFLLRKKLTAARVPSHMEENAFAFTSVRKWLLCRSQIMFQNNFLQNWWQEEVSHVFVWRWDEASTVSPSLFIFFVCVFFFRDSNLKASEVRPLKSPRLQASLSFWTASFQGGRIGGAEHFGAFWKHKRIHDFGNIRKTRQSGWWIINFSILE